MRYYLDVYLGSYVILPRYLTSTPFSTPKLMLYSSKSKEIELFLHAVEYYPNPTLNLGKSIHFGCSSR